MRNSVAGLHGGLKEFKMLEPVTAVALVPNSGRAIIAYGDLKQTTLASPDLSARMLRPFGHHSGRVNALFATPDILVSAGTDGVMQIWSLKSNPPTHLRSVPCDPFVTSLAISNDEQFIASGSAAGDALLYRISSGHSTVLNCGLINPEGVAFVPGTSILVIGGSYSQDGIAVVSGTTQKVLKRFAGFPVRGLHVIDKNLVTVGVNSYGQGHSSLIRVLDLQNGSVVAEWSLGNRVIYDIPYSDGARGAIAVVSDQADSRYNQQLVVVDLAGVREIISTSRGPLRTALDVGTLQLVTGDGNGVVNRFRIARRGNQLLVQR